MNRLIKKYSGKQVGILYHYTDVWRLIKILNEGSISSMSNDGISTTRNKNFIATRRMITSNCECCIILDGDSISNTYKVEPYNDFQECRNGKSKAQIYDEDEELINTSRLPLTYMTGINLYKAKINNSTFETIEIQNDLKFNSVEEIQEYLYKEHNVSANII